MENAVFIRLLDDYLLEHPTEVEGVSVMPVGGKHQTVIRHDVLFRFSDWLYEHGYIN